MKAEAWIFLACTIFFALVTPTYWFATATSQFGGEWAGTVALGMCALLFGMLTLYVGLHARKMDPRPEDRLDAEVNEGAGELGFFPPFSWWPLWAAMSVAGVSFSIAMKAWWLLVIAFVVGAITLSGWIFEYYRGEHSH